MNRKIAVINLLVDSKQPLTTAQLAEKMNVSSRTIRSDLLDIEVEVLAHHLKLVKKPAVGISIEGTGYNKDQLCLDLASENRSLLEPYSKESRRDFILTKLLLGKNRLYIEYFTQALYTSKSTIEKDLIYLSDWLQLHHLKLERKDNQGLYISGKEIDIRNAIAIVVSAMEDHSGPIEKIMSEYIGINIEKIQRLLNNWASCFHVALGAGNIKNLAFHIAILIHRVQQEKMITMNKVIAPQIKEEKQQDMMMDLIDRIEKMAGINIPKEEIRYLSLHLIGMTLDSDVSMLDKKSMDELKTIAEEIADEFIINVEEIVYLGLANSLSLRESLIVHLLPTIYRLKCGLNLYNPLLYKIKDHYASAYALASIINSSFKKKLGKEVGEEEIAFIALHVLLAIEKAKGKLRIAVVCPLGRGISRFLSIKLEEKFPLINFLNCPLKDITKSTGPYVDMVITTVPITIDKPCITISAILSEEDVKLIKTMIHNFERRNPKFFSLQTIMVQHNHVEKNKILKDLANRLAICHYVDHTFLDGVLKREEIGPTEIGNGIVLTHGFYKSVKRTQIAFCKLKYPVLWNTSMVTFIVMVAIEKNDAKNIMQMDWLYKTLNNEIAMRKIMESLEEEEIYHILLTEHDKY